MSRVHAAAHSRSKPWSEALAVWRLTQQIGILRCSLHLKLQDLQEGQLHNLVCVTGEQVDVRNGELAELQAAAEVERNAFQQVQQMLCGS